MFCRHTKKTRMHSSRMCFTCSLLYRGGVSLTETPRQRPPRQRPPGQRAPRQRPPQTETPMGRDPQDRDPLDRDPGTETPWTETLPWSCDMWCMLEQRPPLVNRMTHRCKNIILPQLRCGR